MRYHGAFHSAVLTFLAFLFRSGNLRHTTPHVRGGNADTRIPEDHQRERESVCARERKREGKRESKRARERARERENERERERESERERASERENTSEREQERER